MNANCVPASSAKALLCVSEQTERPHWKRAHPLRFDRCGEEVKTVIRQPRQPGQVQRRLIFMRITGLRDIFRHRTPYQFRFRNALSSGGYSVREARIAIAKAEGSFLRRLTESADDKARRARLRR